MPVGPGTVTPDEPHRVASARTHSAARGRASLRGDGGLREKGGPHKPLFFVFLVTTEQVRVTDGARLHTVRKGGPTARNNTSTLKYYWARF